MPTVPITDKTAPPQAGPQPSRTNLLMAAAHMYQLSNKADWARNPTNIRKYGALDQENEAKAIEDAITKGVPLPQPRPKGIDQ